ncbi:hypothetical protein CSKR_105888 [Clonorchis sinensis]|uniref:Uncharacterized protein n=1 Tax=Clonorchis sinensis TaxID=79923 RepID=A0A419QHB7_CLOSI|nr:hypothetical protein CSKR_105888 [Clonorchis sinensis]
MAAFYPKFSFRLFLVDFHLRVGPPLVYFYTKEQMQQYGLVRLSIYAIDQWVSSIPPTSVDQLAAATLDRLVSRFTVHSQWLEREFTDRKVRSWNPTSESRLLLSRLGQPGSIPALVLPSGGMAARHRKGVTAGRI